MVPLGWEIIPMDLELDSWSFGKRANGVFRRPSLCEEPAWRLNANRSSSMTDSISWWRTENLYAPKGKEGPHMARGGRPAHRPAPSA